MCPQHEYIAEYVPLDTALGIEATHAAADILIEITAAALAWREAEQRRHEALLFMQAAKSGEEYRAASERLAPLGRNRDAALARFTLALSEVQP